MRASDSSKSQEWDLAKLCGLSAGQLFSRTRSARVADYSSAPCLTQFGKTQMRGQSRCQGFHGLGMPTAAPGPGASSGWGLTLGKWKEQWGSAAIQAWTEVRRGLQCFGQRPVKTRGHLSGRVFDDWKFPACCLRLLTSVKNSKGYESRQTQITCGQSKQ